MKKIKIALVIASLGLIGTANAASVQHDMNVSASLEKGCIIKIGDGTGNTFDFGTIVPNEGNMLIKASSIGTLCSNQVPFEIKLKFNSNSEAGQRYMRNVNGDISDKLAYTINHLRPNYIIPGFGDGVLGSTYKGIGDGVNYMGSAINIKLRNNQFVAPGVYVDEVEVAVEY